MQNKTKLIHIGNSFCQNMVQRGGGVKDLFVRIVKYNQNSQTHGHLVLELLVHVCDSMGANLVNTIAEKISQSLEEQQLITGKIILKILSNLSVYRKSTAEFKLKLSSMNYKGTSGEDLANRIILAQEIAENDIYRATTHNKGIMNGIDAVALALGQDWRAIEAGSHAFASLNPKTCTYDEKGYRPLTYYKIIEVKGEKFLYGNLTLPMAVGVVGGAINSNENYQNLLKLLGNPNAQQLSHIMVSVGLAQNFAALRALVSEGIQKGHMGLQARNFAIAAGVPDYLIPDVVNFMKNNKSISLNTAKYYLESHNLYNELRAKSLEKLSSVTAAKNLSSFYIEIDYSFLKEPLIMNFLLSTRIHPPIHFTLRSRNVNTEDNRVNELYKTLFGEYKNTDWLHEFFKFVNHFDFGGQQKNLSELYQIKYKLKMIMIVFFMVTYNLLKYDFKQTKSFLEKIMDNCSWDRSQYSYDKLSSFIPDCSMQLDFGLSVVLELSEIMKFYLNNYVKSRVMKDKIMAEVKGSVDSFVKMNEIKIKIDKGEMILNKELLYEFINYRINRLNARIMILCDLAFNDEVVNEEALNNFMAIGRYCEIKITQLRDYMRHTEGNDFLNSFDMFKTICEKEGVTDSKQIKKEYFKIMEQDMNLLRNQFGDQDQFKNILSYIEKDLENYFVQAERKPKL
jgi:hydroxymethylglutaryl-CoA reductase